jgi:hypothetical protein
MGAKDARTGRAGAGPTRGGHGKDHTQSPSNNNPAPPSKPPSKPDQEIVDNGDEGAE